ncbi:MAG: NAD(P)/FAD-dependent oxidoreductase [Deltaproteobacteria bacterium]|nr:NAD(P)/FAD-dependent oxidoreductase [Deltaproteobacteria bacterium]
MFDYDVIVVGCGPTGLMAVAELEEKGINVLGIDKKPRLDKNIRSASGFFFDGLEMNGEHIHLEPLKGKTKIVYTKCGFSIEYSKTMEGIYHTHIISNSGSHFQATSRKKPLYHLFNPTTWLSDRYERTKALGVPFMTNTLVLRAKEINGGVEVTMRTKGKTTSKTCRKLLASDGLQSRIARTLGLNKDRLCFGKGPTIEYEMINVDCPLDRGDIYVTGENNIGKPGGIFLVPSPRGEGAYRIETMSALPGVTAYDIIEFFTKNSSYAKWFEKAETVEKSGAIVEVFTPIKTPYRGNILLAGDAAAFAECLYQGATMCGYMAAQAIENELKGKNGFEEYTNWWNSFFEWNRDPQRMADYPKRTLFLRFFAQDEIDFLFNLSKKHPAVVDEMEVGVFDYTNAVMDHFLSLPSVPEQLREKIKMVKEAGMDKLATVISKRQS